MDTTIIQVPISKALRREALKAVEFHGFSSIQEVLRIFLKKFASYNVDVNFFSAKPADVILSAKNDRRYDKMIKDLDSGKVKPVTFSGKRPIEDIMKYLNE